jgi:hypothetical protein
MTEADTNQRLGLRFTRDFSFYDEHGTHLWRSYRAGDVVSDEKEIHWLVGIAAPVVEQPISFRR